MKYAWIENSVIRDVCHGNPAECYHPDIAAHYTEHVPDDAANGDGWDGTTLAKPEAVIPETTTPPRPCVSPVEFKLLWTSPERIAIKLLKATDAVIADLFEIMDDPRLETVNLALQSTQDAVDYILGKLVTGGTITSESKPARLEAILSGVFL